MYLSGSQLVEVHILLHILAGVLSLQLHSFAEDYRQLWSSGDAPFYKAPLPKLHVGDELAALLDVAPAGES